MTTTGEAILFWVLAPVAVAGALGLVFARNYGAGWSLEFDRIGIQWI